MKYTRRSWWLGALVAVMLPIALGAGPPEPYQLTRTTIDGGGGSMSGGGFELKATIGQPDAGASTGRGYALSGGYWFAQPPGDCSADGLVDLLDYRLYEQCVTGPIGPAPTGACRCFDIDQSGTVDLIDFWIIQSEYTN